MPNPCRVRLGSYRTGDGVARTAAGAGTTAAVRACPGGGPAPGADHPTGTLLGWVPGISRPFPPTAPLSSRPGRDDQVHCRAVPSPLTVAQPESRMRTGGYAWPWAENSSRSAPGRAAGQCRSPPGAGGSRHSAAARARTRGASVIVAVRGRISPGRARGEPERDPVQPPRAGAERNPGRRGGGRGPRAPGVRGRLAGAAGHGAAASGHHEQGADPAQDVSGGPARPPRADRPAHPAPPSLSRLPAHAPSLGRAGAAAGSPGPELTTPGVRSPRAGGSSCAGRRAGDPAPGQVPVTPGRHTRNDGAGPVLHSR